MNYRLDLPPGKTDFINTPGDFFAVVQSSVDLEIGLVGREKALYAQGDTYTCAPGESFKSLGIRNPTTATVTVIIFSGFGRYSQSRLSVMEPKTEAVGWSGSSLAAGSGVDFPPLLSATRVRRKHLIISNLDPSANLYLRDKADPTPGVIAVIGGGEKMQFSVSETVEVFNPGGAPVSCSIGEVYWIV